MTARLLALAGALALAGCGAPDENWPAPSPALWEATGKDGAQGWLFGTIHALPDGAKWDTALLEANLGQAGVLVVEIADLADRDAAAAAYSAARRGTGLPPLLKRVPPANRPELAAALARSGLDEADFAATDSWAAAIEISGAALGDDVENGVDRVLLERGMPVVGLEGYAEQFAIFDGLPAADQAVMLTQAVRDADATKRRRLARAWVAGDLATIGREMDGGILTDPELRQALLVGRNQAWVGRVAALIEGKRRPFVAVGEAHMLGPMGLPALLAARGFTVRRIQ